MEAALMALVVMAEASTVVVAMAAVGMVAATAIANSRLDLFRNGSKAGSRMPAVLIFRVFSLKSSRDSVSTSGIVTGLI
jgi:hypothetical protein